MGVFGVQAVVTLVMISVLQKITPLYSLGKWLVLGQNLVKYLFPRNEELKKLGGVPVEKNGKRKKTYLPEQTTVNESFTIPKNINLTLDTARITILDVMTSRFYTDFVWLIDFTVCTAIVVAVTLVIQEYLSPGGTNEYGMSSMWCCLLLAFSLKLLFSLVSSYKLDENSGEVVLVSLFAFFFLVAAMLVLIVDDEMLEFHLAPCHENFTMAATTFLKKHEITSVGPTSLISCRVFLAFLSGFIGCLLTFPGIRLARSHIDAIKYADGRPLLQFLMYVDFLFPVLLLFLWVPPISRRVIVGKTVPGTKYEVSDLIFDIARDCIIFVFTVLRLVLLRYRLQAYLNSACVKVQAMRREAGRISNIELQTMIIRIKQYLCVVIVQLVAPLCMILSLIFMSWSLSGAGVVSTGEQPLPSSDNTMKTIQDQVQEFTITLAELRAVFSNHLLRSICSYLIWWVISSWTATTYFGLFYVSYMITQ